ncbi:hypothetical protein AX774_g2336 [Zancudomyces culisetae]|uniref:Uncharacterized protein n=1 Tax=Zancudomyces culisetae TaxID=1213189 RepID=A0A1R1PT21_ZANCU|nr:hypothetical protein AX774_g2336 [Zancudomyces culisetae]|eukprot:OMH84146.1 hypothetical protein AX774_g2336 [Zancudomyces culisetae]
MFPIPEAYKDERTGKIVRPPRPKVEVVGPEEFMFVTITLIQNQGKEGEKEDERGQGQDQGQPSLGVIVTPSGEAQRTTLQFLETPKSVMYEKPYIAVLYSSGKIEIHNTFTFENTLEQTIELPEKTKKLRKMVWLTSPRVLTSTTRFGSKKDDVLLKMLGLEEESRLPCMALVYNNESVDLILKKPSIAKIYDILAQEDIEIAIKKVEDMLDKKAYDEPEYGTFVETHLRQIYKYAGLVCMKKLLYEEALTNFRKGGVDPILLIKLFAEVRNGMDLEKGIESVAREFTEMDEGKYNKLLQEMKNGSYLIPKVNVRKETISNETNEQGFISLLSRYLKFCRRTIIKNSHEVEKLEIVDNVLSILYIDQKEVDKLKGLITEFSHINSEFVAQYLYKTHRMYFLASWVYKEFGEPEEVLKIWNQLLIGELNDEEFKLTHKEYLEYLKSVSNELLMVDCLYKLLTDKTLELAVQIFELLSSDTISSLDINHILQKIESLTNASTNDNSATNSYLTSFLERWLSSTKNRNSDIYKHYTKLLMVYIDEVYFWFYSTTEQISDNREYDYDGDNSNRLVGNSRLIKLENEFLSHKSTNALVPLRLFLHKSLKAQEANRTDEDFYYSLKLVNKLLDSSLSFLRSIQTDNKNHEDSAGDEDSIVQSVVDYIYSRFGQGSEKSLVVGLELVILYLKRGDVDKALRLLVHDICDYGEAECLLSLNTESNHNLLTLGLPITLKILIPQHTLSSLMLLTDSANEKKLLTLITLYSTHPTDLDTCYTLIARLLNRFCDCISLSSVVQHLPNDFLLSSLYLPYFLNSFESQTSKLAVTDIQLSLIHCMDTEKTHIAEQSPSEYGSKCGNSLNRQNFVVLEKSTRCTICKLPMIDANISNEDGFAYNPLTSTVYHMHCI